MQGWRLWGTLASSWAGKDPHWCLMCMNQVAASAGAQGMGGHSRLHPRPHPPSIPVLFPLGHTQRWPMGDKHVHAIGDQVPFLQQSLATREVEAPTVEPGLPAGEAGFRVGLKG